MKAYIIMALLVFSAAFLLSDTAKAAPGNQQNYTLHSMTVLNDIVLPSGNHSIRWEYEWTWRDTTTKSLVFEEFKPATDTKQMQEIEKRTNKRITKTIENTMKQESKNPPTCTLCTGPRPPSDTP